MTGGAGGSREGEPLRWTGERADRLTLPTKGLTHPLRRALKDPVGSIGRRWGPSARSEMEGQAQAMTADLRPFGCGSKSVRQKPSAVVRTEGGRQRVRSGEGRLV